MHMIKYYFEISNKIDEISLTKSFLQNMPSLYVINNISNRNPRDVDSTPLLKY